METSETPEPAVPPEGRAMPEPPEPEEPAKPGDLEVEDSAFMDPDKAREDDTIDDAENDVPAE